jgi:acetyl-CoA/propionyl-CoA carboxylase biotin carboxyl carrier protein
VPCAARRDGDALMATVDGLTRRYACALDGDTLWLGRDGRAWGIRELAPLDAAASAEAGVGGPVLSPMPGTITAVEVVDGQLVDAGARLIVVEAMKMEHVLTAPVSGVVRELRVRPGDTVAKDAVLLLVEPEVE